MEIKILNPVYAEIVNKKEIYLLQPCMQFEKTFWMQGRYKKERKTYMSSMIDKKGQFLAGLIPHVEEYCFNNKIPLTITPCPKMEKIKQIKPHLEGITFREDQKMLIDNALKYKRGFIVAPTGGGKTILQCGIASAFPNARILYLVHTLSLLTQAAEEFKKFGFTPTLMSGEHFGKISHLTIASIQTFSKIPPEEYVNKFEIVLIDEGHHVRSLNSSYAKVLTCLLAPIRLAFTATLPTDTESAFASAGLIGAVIGETTVQDGVEQGVLAKPRIRIIKAPMNHAVKAMHNYQKVYEEGVVRNKEKNKLIADVVIEYMKEKKTCLIVVQKIEHGKILKDLIPDSFFVQGATEGSVREEIKANLSDKKIHSVICTKVWMEGINIPSLAVIFNAGGGLSEISVLQACGRGLRTTAEKREIIICDIFDPSNNFLISHFASRFALYCDLGWI